MSRKWMMYFVRLASVAGFAFMAGLAGVACVAWGLGAIAIMPTEAHATDDWNCRPPIRIAVDLGYCYGFVETYFEAVRAENVLAEIERTDIQARVRHAHQTCYATDYDSQKTLGGLAFSSYLNLDDDTLLKTTAADCSGLLEHYSTQVEGGKVAE